MEKIIVNEFEYGKALLYLTELVENLRGLSILADWYYRKTDDYDLTDELPCVLRHFSDSARSISDDIDSLHTTLDNMAVKAEKYTSPEMQQAAGKSA